MKTFKINKNIEVVCRSENTRYGFRHLAELQKNGWEAIATAKVCYYNRTWERYEYESVLEKLVENCEENGEVLTTAQLRAFKKYVKNYDRVEDDLKPLKTIAGIAQLGEIFGANKKEKNDWKTRILKAGLENKGLIIPEDWDELDEIEKEKRLNGAIKQLS